MLTVTQSFIATFRPSRALSGIQVCLPDEARDGRNVALKFLSDCWCARLSKADFYIRTLACLISFMTDNNTASENA